MSIEIKDNFLDQQDFNVIKNTMFGYDFPWYYQKNKVYSSEAPIPYMFQFIHVFYQDLGPTSSFFNLLLPLIDKINPKALVRIKANLTTRTPEIITYGHHVDYDETKLLKTAVFYLNNNNGLTIFEDGSQIESVENRLVIFDCDMRHSGTSCTDENVRSVININFYDIA